MSHSNIPVLNNDFTFSTQIPARAVMTSTFTDVGVFFADQTALSVTPTLVGLSGNNNCMMPISGDIPFKQSGVGFFSIAIVRFEGDDVEVGDVVGPKLSKSTDEVKSYTGSPYMQADTFGQGWRVLAIDYDAELMMVQPIFEHELACDFGFDGRLMYQLTPGPASGVSSTAFGTRRLRHAYGEAIPVA